MIGQTISHFRILEKLGEGGMGVVYKAQDTHLDRPVALKFLPSDLIRDPEAKERFIHEAKAASALQHANICTIHDIEEHDGQLFIVMDCYEGESLKKRIDRGPLKIEEAVNIAVQIAQGLQKAHEKGIVHRDIKPANVLITTDDVAKIVDFGLAKLTGRSALTKSGTTAGTAAYMSPEQAKGEQVDQRTDIWSLGVLLYEMLAGRRPFDAEYETALLYSIMNADPQPITNLRTGVPMELERTISKCLAKSREERYQHADELIVDLRRTHPISTSLPAGSQSIPTTRGRRIRTRLILSAAAMVVVAFWFWFFLGKPSGEMSELRKKSIAVLPFSPFGRTFDDTVFADGIHDDILTQLSKISGLRVIARTSMALYRDSKKTPQQIANELDVGYLLEGSTRHSGGKIRITAQLIKTADEGHLWADTYDRSDADIFAVQSDIAQRIASSMEAVLSPAERASVEEIPTKSTEAYSYYLRGNYYWENYIDSAANAKSAELYEKAAEKDPTFAQAFARASVANGAVYFGWAGTPALHARITSALEKARTLNPEDPVVHWAQGVYYLYCDTVRGMTDRDKLTLAEFQKTLKRRPNWADVYADMSTVLSREGALPEARESIRRYFSLNPMGLALEWGPWTISRWLKEWDVARKEVDEYIARHPDDLEGYSDKARILIDGFGDLESARAVLEYGMTLPLNQGRDRRWLITSNDLWIVDYYQGRYQKALACLVDLPGEDAGQNFDRWLRRGQTYLVLNQRASAMSCFDKALSIAVQRRTEYWRHYQAGIALAWRGEHDKAGIELEKATRLDLRWTQRKDVEEARARAALLGGDEKGALNLIEQLIPQPGFLTVWNLRLDPAYAPLRRNPRFQVLIAEKK